MLTSTQRRDARLAMMCSAVMAEFGHSADNGVTTAMLEELVCSLQESEVAFHNRRGQYLLNLWDAKNYHEAIESIEGLFDRLADGLGWKP